MIYIFWLTGFALSIIAFVISLVKYLKMPYKNRKSKFLVSTGVISIIFFIPIALVLLLIIGLNPLKATSDSEVA